MTKRIGMGCILGLLSLAVSSRAMAEDEPPAQADSSTAVVPRVHHAPIAVARVGQPLAIVAQLTHPELVQTLTLHYEADDSKAAVPMLRSEGGAYVGVIPASNVGTGTVAYSIELLHIDGESMPGFRSLEDPHRVQIPADRLDVREEELMQELDGRRSNIATVGEYVDFGNAQTLCDPADSGCSPAIADEYWRVEGKYTYRFLRTVAELSIRGGVVRGTSRGLDPTSGATTEQEVGLNYGAPSVRFRLADRWHLETELLASITEVGFSVGSGGSLHIGDPYGSKLVAGAEVIGIDSDTYFGSRFYSRIDIRAHRRVFIAPVVEVTDFPHADSFGVRLLADGRVAIAGGFAATVRGGYQARRAASGGPTLGGGLELAF